MAALAYVFPPLSGALAFFNSSRAIVRFHGLQAVAFGLTWPLILYGCSAVSATATRLAFVSGFILWAALIIAAGRGGKLRLPLVGLVCARLAELPTDVP